MAWLRKNLSHIQLLIIRIKKKIVHTRIPSSKYFRKILCHPVYQNGENKVWKIARIIIKEEGGGEARRRYEYCASAPVLIEFLPARSQQCHIADLSGRIPSLACQIFRTLVVFRTQLGGNSSSSCTGRVNWVFYYTKWLRFRRLA
jgi:hypothetical protein